MLEYNHKYKVYRHPALKLNQNTTSYGGMKITINISGIVWEPPTYRSWDGFNGHISALEELGVDPIIGFFLVQWPGISSEDLMFLIEHKDDVMDEVREYYHPFVNQFNKIGMALVRQWIDSYRNVKFHSFNEHYNIYRIVKNKVNRKILFSVLYTYKPVVDVDDPEYERKLELINSLKAPSEEKILSILFFGVYKESIGNAIKRFIPNNPDMLYIFNTISKYCIKLKVDLFRLNFNKLVISRNMQEVCLSVGFKHSDVKWIMAMDLTKEKKIYFINKFFHIGNEWLVLQQIYVEFNIPSNISQYMTYWGAEDIRPQYYADLIRFVLKHKSKWAKTKVVHGPNGRTITVHLHQLISHITPEILTNHKIGWDKVMCEIERKEMEKLQEQFQQDEKLVKQFPIEKLPVDVKPLKTIGDIRMEGESMDHCVFQYVQVCMENTYLFHVGPPAPKGATAEVFIKDNKFHLAQCRGYRNDRESGYTNVFQEPMEKLVETWNKTK